MMHPIHAAVLGLVEGVTEFLPVSSTGHLILVAYLLGLRGEAVKTYEVVIQAGALGAVLGLYRARLASVWQGALGRDPAGRTLGRNLLLSFVPAAVAGLLLHRAIKRLFVPSLVGLALACGGVLMLAVEWTKSRRRPSTRPLESLTVPGAFFIGVLQCLALWPGMSRSMVTIVGGLLLGLSPAAAAEYSFLLAVPTLGAATLFDAVVSGRALVQEAGALTVAIGFVIALLVAAAAIRGLLRYLSQHGLTLFGWYRLAVAGCIWWLGPQG